MAYYSKAHYRRVSQPVDSPAAIVDRQWRNAASEQARVARERKYPVITPENFADANKFQEDEYQRVYNELKNDRN